MKFNRQQKDSAISSICTLAIMVVAVVLCAWMGYWPPDPPIEEEGMGVAGEVLGEIEGFGNNDMADFDNNVTAPSSASAPSSESYTTSEEPTPFAKQTKTDQKTTPNILKESSTEQKKENTSSETKNADNQTSNPNFTFKGRRNGTDSEGKGDANGSGQTGSVDGTKGATGTAGTGIGVEIGGMGNRRVRGTVPIPDQKKEFPDGTVVVRIKVDRQGNVVDVEAPVKGSVNQTSQMVEAAKTAAKRAHFTADADAPEFQYGTIKYQFRKRG